MLSGYPLTDAKFKNYQHNLFSHPAVKDRHFDNINIFDYLGDINRLVNDSMVANVFYAENIFDVDVVKELYGRRDEFDLFIFDRIMNQVTKIYY